MKRRIISLLLACVMLASLFSLFSCKQDDTPSERPLHIIDDNYRNWYEIFVYSYFDTDNDGIGDLNGVTEKLDYIQEMGYNGIWLMPIHPSPTYHKYDVTDYYAIDPAYGTLEDFDKLVEEAHKRGIKVILDLVLNHTAEAHPWFQEAVKYIRQNGEVGGEYAEYYNFYSHNPGTGYSPITGTPYYYEARFWSGMPDLNLDSSRVREEITEIMTYWLRDHDVDGFRLDAVTSYYKGDVNKNVAFLSWVNTTAKSIKEDAYLVGEAWEGSDTLIDRYYDSGIDSFFLFTGSQGTGEIASIVKQQSGSRLGKYMTKMQEVYQDGILAPFLGNHDTMRPGSFMPGIENVKMAGGVLAMMNGSTFVYYGEEIGMISKDGLNSDPRKRIAMYWSDKSVYPGWCYTTPEGISVGRDSYYYPSVETQADDPTSILNYYKQAMKLRNQFPAIARGTVRDLSSGDNSYICILEKTWGEEQIVIVFNMDTFEQTVSLDLGALGVSEIVGELYVDVATHATLDGTGSLVLPAQSIIILQ